MKILFIHPNMPGQYKHLCRQFAEDPNNQVVFLTRSNNVEIPNVKRVFYQPRRTPSPHTHRYIVGTERAVLQGQEVWRVCKKLRNEEGFIPDVICAHPGWGDALYVKDIYPEASLLSFLEFYYKAKGQDVNFDPEDPGRPDDDARVRTKNLVNMMNLEAMDWGVSPTHWQRSVHPSVYQPQISVLHDGIDTQHAAKPDADAVFEVSDSLKFKKGDEVVTYIARNLEPYRGFPTFMRAAEKILRDRPNCHIVAVGADGVSYGKQPPKGTTYRQIMLNQVNLDHDRLHFVGTLPYQKLIKMLQVSAAHIYLTYPFVLSWSTLEAMACGCALIGSKTQPVEEVITHGENGLLVDFFSPDDVAQKVFQVLDDASGMAEMREKARQFVVDRYELEKLLPLHMQLVRDVAEKKFPPPVHKEIEALYSEEEIKRWAA